VNARFHIEVTGDLASMASMAAHTRSRDDDDRRIKTFTRWTLAGALASTAGFGGLAAAATHHAQAGDSSSVATSSESESDSDSSTFTPSTSDPQQSFSPPVAQSGGS
jgi:hypothetical protein